MTDMHMLPMTTTGPPAIAVVFPLEGIPRIALSTQPDDPTHTTAEDADLFVRIIRELDPEWNELLAHAFELAGMPPLDDEE